MMQSKLTWPETGGYYYHPFYHPDDRSLLDEFDNEQLPSCSFFQKESDGSMTISISYLDATIRTTTYYLSNYGVVGLSILGVFILGCQLRKILQQHYPSSYTRQVQLEIGAGCIQALPKEFTVRKTNYAYFILCRRIGLIWYLLWFGVFSHLLIAINYHQSSKQHEDEGGGIQASTGDDFSETNLFYLNESFENGGLNSIVDLTQNYWITRISYLCALMSLPGLIIGILSNQWLACINEYRTSKALALTSALRCITGRLGGESSTSSSSGRGAGASDNSSEHSVYTSSNNYNNNSLRSGDNNNDTGSEDYDDDIRAIRRTDSVATMSPAPLVILLLTRQRRRHAYISWIMFIAFTVASAYIMWVPTIVISSFYTKAIVAIITLILSIICTGTMITKRFTQNNKQSSRNKQSHRGGGRRQNQQRLQQHRNNSDTSMSDGNDTSNLGGGIAAAVGLSEQQERELEEIQNEEFMLVGLDNAVDDTDVSDVEDGGETKKNTSTSSGGDLLPTVVPSTASNRSVSQSSEIDIVNNNSNNNNEETTRSSLTDEVTNHSGGTTTGSSTGSSSNGDGDGDGFGCSSLSLSAAILFGCSQYALLVGILVRYWFYPKCGSRQAYYEECYMNCPLLPSYEYNHNFIYTVIEGFSIFLLFLGGCCLPS